MQENDKSIAILHILIFMKIYKKGEIRWKYTDIYIFIEENTKFIKILHSFMKETYVDNITVIFMQKSDKSVKIILIFAFFRNEENNWIILLIFSFLCRKLKNLL